MRCPEVVANSNRLLVMRAGRIRSEIDSTAATDAEVQALVEATA